MRKQNQVWPSILTLTYWFFFVPIIWLQSVSKIFMGYKMGKQNQVWSFILTLTYWIFFVHIIWLQSVSTE